MLTLSPSSWPSYVLILLSPLLLTLTRCCQCSLSFVATVIGVDSVSFVNAVRHVDYISFVAAVVDIDTFIVIVCVDTMSFVASDVFIT